MRRGLEHDKARQEAKFRQIEEQIQRDTQRALQEKAKKREAAFNEMFKKVSDGLNGTDPLIKVRLFRCTIMICNRPPM